VKQAFQGQEVCSLTWISKPCALKFFGNPSEE